MASDDASRRPVDWVVLDLGETLVDETRSWAEWAAWFGVPTLTFFAVLGAVIAERRPHTDAFAVLRPGCDVADEVRRKTAAGFGWSVTADDLYPDALSTLRELRRRGYRLAVMANQPIEVEAFLQSLPVDRVATSASWGVAKPEPAFFARVAAELGSPADRIAYVGDRVDNDVLPARAAGMTAVHLRRGPWGVIHSTWPEAAQADLGIVELGALPDALETLAPVRTAGRT